MNEAKDKAEEINARTLQEFGVEKQKFLDQERDKIRAEYERKLKQLDTRKAIARSGAINKSRLEKIKSRQEMIAKVADNSKKQLVKELQNPEAHKKFITNLIAQGLLMLLEDE